jgi:hypothetical protein
VVTVRLGVEDLANVRFAFSPLWECVAAFRTCRDPARHAVHLPWVAAIDRRLRDTNWALLEAVARAPSGLVPDFLAPPPVTPLARFASEIAMFRRTSVPIISREVSAAYPNGVPTHVAAALRDPAAFIDTLGKLLNTFWVRALAPTWPRLVARLEAEVLFRSRALAWGGASALFQDLHASVRYMRRARGGTLHIHAHDRYDRAARGAGMLLVPSVFAWPDVYVAARPPWRPTLAYPARGAADLWSSQEAPRNASLAALVGARRASVLTRLDTPHTTLELAHALGLSPGAASTQVTTLWRAGIADRTRVGRRVFYVLNGRGQAFKGALDRTPRSPDATGIGGRFASKPQRAKQ